MNQAYQRGKITTHLHVLPREVRDFLRKVPDVVDGTRRHLIGLDDSGCESNAVIVFTEGWRLVNDTRSTLAGDIGVV